MKWTQAENVSYAHRVFHKLGEWLIFEEVVAHATYVTANSSHCKKKEILSQLI